MERAQSYRVSHLFVQPTREAIKKQHEPTFERKEVEWQRQRRAEPEAKVPPPRFLRISIIPNPSVVTILIHTNSHI